MTRETRTQQHTGRFRVAGQFTLLAGTWGASFLLIEIALEGLSVTQVVWSRMVFGAAALAVVMLAATPWAAATPVRLDARVAVSAVVLGAAGTGLAYVWNNNVVAAWGAANASAVTYLTPVVGVVLGVLVLGEPLTWNEPVGAALVIAGILVAHGRLRLPRRRPRTLAAAPERARPQPERVTEIQT